MFIGEHAQQDVSIQFWTFESCTSDDQSSGARAVLAGECVARERISSLAETSSERLAAKSSS